MKKISLLFILAFCFCFYGATVYGQSIIEAEYFFDSDPGAGNATPLIITPGDTVISLDTVDVAGLTIGYHYVYVRVKDSLGRFSHPTRQKFYVFDGRTPMIVNHDAPIVYAEIFYDGPDPGFGNGTPLVIQQGDTVTFDDSISVAGLTIGMHAVTVRVLDSAGYWSYPVQDSFEVCTNYGPIPMFAWDVDRKTVFFWDSSHYVTNYHWDFGDGTTDTTVNPSHTYASGGTYQVQLTTHNECGSHTFTQTVGANGLKDFEPKFHGNDGFFSMYIEGFGFTSASTVRLERAGSPTILPEATIFLTGEKFQANFRVNRVDTGFYNLIYVSPTGINDTIMNGFRFEESSSYNLWFQVNGPNPILVNRPTRFQMVVGNNGNKAAYAVPAMLRVLGEGVMGNLLSSITYTDSFPDSLKTVIPPSHFYPYFDSLKNDSAMLLACVIPMILPGEEVRIDFEITSRIGNHYIFNIDSYVGDPLITPAQLDLMGLETNCDWVPPCVDCWLELFGGIPIIGCGIGTFSLTCLIQDMILNGKEVDYVDLAGELGATILACLPPTPGQSAKDFIFSSTNLLGFVWGGSKSLDCFTKEDCKDDPNEPPPHSGGVEVVSSGDPNLKAGPLGVGASNWTPYLNTFPYLIFFENVDTATAPAAEAIIFDTIDTQVFDIHTFKFWGFGFADSTYLFQSGQDSFVVDIDLRPSKATILRVSGQLDKIKGIATWRFVSLDTARRALNQVVADGFLPPNINKPEGEGFVSFSIDILPTVVSGDVVENEATIIFDYNDPIRTPLAFNTIDNDRPSSLMDTLAPISQDTLINLSWVGSDTKSGVRYYNIYVSTNNDSTFQLWSIVYDTTATTFTGKVDSTYHFMCEAVDSVGNVEQKAFVSEASTRIIAVLAMPTITALGSTRFCEGDSVILRSDSVYARYLWNTGDTTRQIVVRQAGNYHVVGGNGSGISPPSLYTRVQKDSLPAAPVITLSDSAVFCLGDSVQLSGPSGYSLYTWSTGQMDSVITVRNSGQVSLQVTNQHGCESPPADSVFTQTLPLPPKPTIVVNGLLTFCQGDSVELSTSGNPAISTWSTGSSSQSIWVDQNQSVYLTVTGSNGCNSPHSDTLNIQVNPLPAKPQISSSGSLQFCAGDSLILSGPPAFASYSWTNGATTSNTVVNTAGTYSLVVVDSMGCESPSSDTLTTIILNRPAKPTVSNSGALSFCDGDSVVLMGPKGFYTYHWSNSDSTQQIVVRRSGSYALAIRDSNACESPFSVPVSVQVFSNPVTPIIIPVGSLQFCLGDSVLLKAPNGYREYYWSSGDSAKEIWVDTTSNITVSVRDSNDCISPISFPLQTRVLPLPVTPMITIHDSLRFCEGDSVYLAGPADHKGYQWSSGDTTEGIWVFESGIFWLAVKDSNRCQSLPSLRVQTIQDTIPNRPNIERQLGTDTLYVVIPGTGYSWFYNDTLLSGFLGDQIHANKSGIYQVLVENGLCVSDTSDQYHLVKTNLYGATKHPLLSIFPNPSSDILNISTSISISGQINIKIYDLSGKLVFAKTEQAKVENLNTNVDIKSLPSGYYLLEIKADGNSFFRRFMVHHN